METARTEQVFKSRFNGNYCSYSNYSFLCICTSKLNILSTTTKPDFKKNHFHKQIRELVSPVQTEELSFGGGELNSI